MAMIRGDSYSGYGPWLKHNGGVALSRAQTADYDQYVTLLREWGAPHNLTPVAVEERIFRLLRKDGKDQATPPTG